MFNWVLDGFSRFRGKKPVLVNILVRTSKRPNYFKTCIESIRAQTYPSIRILVSCDGEETFSYLKHYKGIEVVRVRPNQEDYEPLPDDYPYENYRFAANLYLNALMDQVTGGFIMFLDDDDLLLHPASVEEIVSHIGSKDDLLFWRVRFPGRDLPEDKFFGKAPVYSHISGIGFAFHFSYVPLATWDGWSGGDYRVASSLYRSVPRKIFMDKTLTGLQRNFRGGGLGRQTDKTE